MIVSDDFGYGDAGCYLGGEARGMPTPNIDRLADEGMMFTSFYAQPSCTPGRAAMQTGRIPNRSGMTTVAFQGQGGGLPAAEWTLASVLKTAGYHTFFAGKWHLGEADYALPNAQGYDEMKYCGLYHLNAYTYGDPTWFPDMDPKLRAMFQRVTKGAMSGNAGEPAKEDFKINGEYVEHAGQGRGRHSVLRCLCREGVARLSRPQRQVRTAVLHEHQFHEGAPAEHAGPGIHSQVAVEDPSSRILSWRTTRESAASWTRCVRSVSTRTRMSSGRPTTAPGRTSIPMPAIRRSAVPRARCVRAAIACSVDRLGAGQDQAGSKNSDIVGGLDYHGDIRLTRPASSCPTNDREGKPIIFDSYDMSPVLFGTGKSARELVLFHGERADARVLPVSGTTRPCSICVATMAQKTGGLAVDSNLGWKGAEMYVATVPQVFDLWQDPQERYDIFMNNYTERTWVMVTISDAIKDLMKTYVKYPPRKPQSETYTGPITLSRQYEQFQFLRDALAKNGFSIPLPTGN